MSSDPEDPGGTRDHLHTIIVTDDQSVPVDVPALRRLASHALDALAIPDDAELSIVLADPERMAALKGAYLGEAVPTDVLAFPMDGAEGDPAGGPHVLGDVVLCPEVAARQADAAGHAAEEEMNLLLVHGILHLLGHDHAEPEETATMRAEERRILGSYAGAVA